MSCLSPQLAESLQCNWLQTSFSQDEGGRITGRHILICSYGWKCLQGILQALKAHPSRRSVCWILQKFLFKSSNFLATLCCQPAR